MRLNLFTRTFRNRLRTLAFGTQPNDGFVGVANGATITVTGAPPGATVTLTPATGSATGNTATANGSGVATFSALILDTYAAAQTLTASSPGATDVVSDAFLVYSPEALPSLVFATTFADFDADAITGELGTESITGVSGSGAGADAADPTAVTEGASFDGGDAFGPIGTNTLWNFVHQTNAFTFVLVYKRNANATMYLAGSATGFSQRGFQIIITTTGFRFLVTDGVSPPAVDHYWTVTHDTTDWHFVAFTMDGTTLKMFADSDTADASTGGTSGVVAGDADKGAYIGSAFGASDRMRGSMGVVLASAADLSGSIAKIRAWATAFMAARGVTLP